MYPRLFTLPPFELFGRMVGPLAMPTYGILLVLGMLAGLWIVTRQARKAGLLPETITDMAVYAIIAGLIGAKVLLWQVLRTRPDGFKFRCQHPLAPYIVYFYCPAARLVVELDGEAHAMGDRPQRDAVRDRKLAEQGLRVVRFGAADVMRDIDSVVRAIVAVCRG